VSRGVTNHSSGAATVPGDPNDDAAHEQPDSSPQADDSESDVAAETTETPETPMAKRLLIGDPLATTNSDEHLLPKRMALPIFASDALSSVAYGPQEMLMILLTGGLAFLSFSPWIALGVIVLLSVIVLSYRQLIKAYPSGGGDYEVARKNLGEIPGVIVAAALLVDYVLTVSVSVASGVDNLISALPVLNGVRVEMAVVFVALIIVVNLRGVREASRAFAIPTYVFIGSVGVMIIVGLVRIAIGHSPVAASAQYAVRSQDIAQAAVFLLILRAFSSGCSALTGIEAVSNGVQAFRKPKIHNAQTTLALLGTIAVVLFAGLTTLALVSHVHYAENPCTELVGWNCNNPQPSLMAQVAAATFGNNSIPFFIVQAATAIVLLLAANTAFNGFPLLGSVLARDGYAPKALNTRGDRLVYSNGMIILGLVAIGVLVIYQANLTNLIQLYIIGVFVSFTLGQCGMIRHWLRGLRELRALPDEQRETPENRAIAFGNRKGLAINSVGATMTAIVLVIVTITKFTHGAWLVFLMIPLLSFLMMGVYRYYRDVEHEIRMDDDLHFGSSGDIAIVLVNRLQKPVVKAIDYALAAKHDKSFAIHVAVTKEDAAALRADWESHDIPMKLVTIESPYRAYATPVISFIEHYREKHGSSVVTVYLPQYIVGHWWESLLHNRRARRIAQQLMLVHGVTITLVPWLLDSTELIYGRRSRPMAGQDREGRPYALRSTLPGMAPPTGTVESSGTLGSAAPLGSADSGR
jgi:amino acid transporter